MRALSFCLLLILLQINLVWAAPDEAPPPTGNDDTAILQGILNQGYVVKLQSGQTYRITSALDLTNGSGITTLGSPATILMTSAFDNMDPFAPITTSDRVGIRGESVDNTVLSNFKIQKEHVNGSYVSAIWLRNVRGTGNSRVRIENVEMWGFSLGGIVNLDSVENFIMHGCTIRDSWAGAPSPGIPSTAKLPQLTAINIDDNRFVSNSQPKDSQHLVIANNTFRNLRFTNGLYNTSRGVFGGDPSRIVAQETDGINIQNKSTDIVITGNFFSVVGEAIDSFGYDVRIERNLIESVYLFGIKLIHGASDSIIWDNKIQGAAIASIVVSGSSIPGVGNIFGNLFIGNDFFRVGARDAYFSTDANFHINSNFPADAPSAMAVWMDPSFADIPYYNVFYSNRTNVTSADTYAKHIIQVKGYAEEAFFYSNILNNTSGRSYHPSICAFNNLCNGIDGNAEVLIDEPSPPSNVVFADFDGNGEDDLFFHWKTSGQNRLYRKSNVRDFSVTENPIGQSGINGDPTHVVGGDFNGDNHSDLLFFWQADGTNRLYYGTTAGGFTFVGNPISTSAISSFPSRLEVGDFNGDGRDDIFFYAPVSGHNLTYAGTTTGFTAGPAAIGTAAINGSPHYVLVGNFDGDKNNVNETLYDIDDLLFYWKDNGTNRFYYGGSTSYTQVLNPILTAAINGYPDKAWVEDLDLDGRSDLDFFWHTDPLRRAFIGQGNRTFVPK